MAYNAGRTEHVVPPEHKNPGLLYESYQAAKLRKWAPVRTYYGHPGEKGEAEIAGDWSFNY